MMRKGLTALCLVVAGCGTAYITPDVSQGSASGAVVRVEAMTAQSVLIANASDYSPRGLPAAFDQYVAPGSTAALGTGGLPQPTADRPGTRPALLELRLPARVPQRPYEIGVGDVLLLATPAPGSSAEELSGLLAAQSRRQGYTVQDDGAIAVPDIGRIPVAGMTLEEAEGTVFQRLVSSQIDPTFSLEVAEFNSQRVSIGGAVARPGVVPISLTPLHLDEALARSGGVTARDLETASVRLYRNGSLYQIPVRDLYSEREMQRIPLLAGDSIFVDTSVDLDQAETYFEQQIRLVQARQSARSAALSALQAELALRRGALSDQRANFQARLELGAVERDHVFITGEVTRQTRVPLPFGTSATLADVLYDEGNGIPTQTANVSQIYVLRGAPDPRDFAGITAWHLDAENAASLILATRFEMRPDDVIFVAEQPITRWNRVLTQSIPSLITSGVAAVAN